MGRKEAGKTNSHNPNESSKDESDSDTSSNEGEGTETIQQKGSEKKNWKRTSKATTKKEVRTIRQQKNSEERKSTRKRKVEDRTQSGSGTTSTKQGSAQRKVEDRTQSGSGKTRTKKGSAKNCGSASCLAGVVLLVVALFVPFLDWSSFFNVADSFIDVHSLDFSYFHDFLEGSTNSGFCNPYKSETCDDFLRKKFQDLALKYRNQSYNTWFTLYAAARDHVSHQPDPKRPVVIMVYRLKNSSRANEILEDIATVYNSVLSPNRNYGNILIDGESFADRDPEETQKTVQEMFEYGFETEAHKVAIVGNFDKLPSCSVFVFYNYCKDAPHKDVAIILTVTARDGKISPDPRAPELEKAVSKLLNEKWKDCPEELPPGKIDTILSAVANNIILLR